MIAKKHRNNYAAYLRSPHWEQLRLGKLSTDGTACECCSFASPSNDVHHLHYHRLYDVSLEDLIVLCRRCHSLAHEIIDSIGSKRMKVMEIQELRVLTTHLVRLILRKRGEELKFTLRRGDGKVLGELRKRSVFLDMKRLHNLLPGIAPAPMESPEKVPKKMNPTHPRVLIYLVKKHPEIRGGLTISAFLRKVANEMTLGKVYSRKRERHLDRIFAV